MGWLRDSGEDWSYDHEGYVVAVEHDTFSVPEWREVGVDDAPRGEFPLRWVQVSCSCGWRSQRLIAPLGTTWFPVSVNFRTEADEDAAREVWATLHRDGLDDESRSVLVRAGLRS